MPRLKVGEVIVRVDKGTTFGENTIYVEKRVSLRVPHLTATLHVNHNDCRPVYRLTTGGLVYMWGRFLYTHTEDPTNRKNFLYM